MTTMTAAATFSVSVVIPARNRAHTLPTCLDSVLAQTCPALEVIVVDDGSSDRTRELVLSYQERGVVYSRLQGARGAQAARNLGIKLARGDWIAFQDSDDIWFPDKLDRQWRALRGHDFRVSTVIHGDGIKREVKTGHDEPLQVPYTAGSCYRQLLLRPAPMFPALLVSRWAILAAGGLDDACPAYQEWDTAIRLARNGEFVHLRKPLFVWMHGSSDTISINHRRDILGFDHVLSSHRSEIIAEHGHGAWRRLKLWNILRALRAGLWAETDLMLVHEHRQPCFVLASLLARLQRYPRGAASILRLAARAGPR